MWRGQSFWGRMSKHSAQILELLCHLIFSLFGECISLSFRVSFVCVLAVISGLYVAQTPSFMVFVYLCIWYITNHFDDRYHFNLFMKYMWITSLGTHDGRSLTLSLFRPPDIIQVYLFSNKKVLGLSNKVT